MELHQLRYAVAVAESKSFSLAAEECFVSQSSLSQQVIKLELELQIRLFLRSTRSVELTEAGEEFVTRAKEILYQVSALEQSMGLYSGLMKGTLNIGTITALDKIDFSARITSFYAQYPNLTVNITQGGSVELIDMLRAKTIDIAFVVLPPSADKKYADIDFNLLGTDEYHLAVPSKHPLASKKTVDLRTVHSERFVFHRSDQGISNLCLGACHDAGFEPNIICRHGGRDIGFSLIRSGLGIGFFPAEDFTGRKHSGIRELRLKTPIFKEICMASLAGGRKSNLVSTAIDFMLKWNQ